MHKVQMNSSASDTIRARVARFNEFDNGHVLFDYQKMTEAEFEERAKAASIKDPNDVYYVAIDNIMDPGTDVYWFQGKSYDYEGAEKALSEYQKSATSGLNSGRRPLNSSEEQVKVSGIVTIYSDFVDFKRSVSEHLLQTAVGDRAKLKFKWVGDNKVEVKAICSVADERKVKILLENSDVTKTITWATSGNSGRRRILGLNSSATIVYPNGMPVSQIDLEKALDYNFGTDRDKDINSYTDAEKQQAVNYWVKKTDRMLNSSASCGDYVKLSTATLKRKLKDASPEEKKAILAELNARGVYPKTSVNSSATQFVDTDGIMGIPGDTWTMKELAEYWDSEQGSDPCLDEYASFDDWVEDTISMMTPLDSSRKNINSNRKVGNSSMRKVVFRGKLNSSRKPAQRGARKKLNSSKKSEIIELTGWSPDDLAEAFDEWLANGGDEYEEDEQFDAFADAVAEAAELGDTDAFGIPLKASRKMNSSRKVGKNPMRKVIFRGKLNSSRKSAQKMNAGKRKLNSSLVDTFLKYHDDAENYQHQEDNFDELYEKLNSYAKSTENPEAMNVDELFVRATPDEQRAMVALIDPSNWNEDLDSSRKLNSSEEEPGEPAEGVAADAPASEGETEVQDTGIDGGEDTAETAEILENALIVQNPETKEVALFVADADDETVPEDVDVIAEVDVVADEAEVLDSSRRLKKFVTAKLNSSKGCLNSDSDVCPGCGKPYGECECEPGTVPYDEIQLPDDTVVEVENILVVQDDEGELGLFMPEDAEEAVPEGYEVVATATPAAEADVLDSSRRMKKSNAKKLNSSVKKKNLNSAKQSLESKVKACLSEAGLTASSVNQGTDMGLPVVNVIFRPKADWRADIDAYYKARTAYSDKYYDSSTVGGWLRDKEGYKDGPEATALNEAQAATNADGAAYEEEIKAAITPVLEAAGLDFSIRYFNECGASAPEQRYWGGSQVFLRVTDPNYQRQAKSGAAKVRNRNQSPERKLINSLQAYFEENGFGWDDRQVYRNAAATPGNYNIVIKGLSGAPDGTEEFIRTTAAELGLDIRRCVVADKEVRIGTSQL